MAYSQTDPAWKYNKLGTSNYTIGNGGCFITAFCNIAAQFGHTINPAQMNSTLTTRGLYVGDGGDVNNDTICKVFPDILYDGYIPFPNDIDLNALRINDKPGVEGIVKLDFNPSQTGVQTHFCRLRGVDAGGNVVIDDSIDGQRVLVKDRYGRQDWAIHGVMLYHKKATTPPPVSPPVTPPAPVDPCASVKAENTALKAQVTTVTSEKAMLQARVSELEKQVKTLTDENNKLKAQVGDASKWQTLKTLLKELIS